MKKIVERLLVMRNTIDDIISQLENEFELTPRTQEQLENIIFNAKLFNTPEKLAMLKQTIEYFFSDSPSKDDKKINVKNKNQFFCLYAALWSRPNVLANTRITDFVKQMALWFPQWITDEKDGKTIKHLKEALYDEQQNWKLNNTQQKVTDWHLFIDQGSMSKAKAKHFEQLAMAIYTSVNQLVKDF